jgi:hypothetical protein
LKENISAPVTKICGIMFREIIEIILKNSFPAMKENISAPVTNICGLMFREIIEIIFKKIRFLL